MDFWLFTMFSTKNNIVHRFAHVFLHMQLFLMYSGASIICQTLLTQTLIQWVWNGACDSALVLCSLAVLMLLVLERHSEKQWSYRGLELLGCKGCGLLPNCSLECSHQSTYISTAHRDSTILHLLQCLLSSDFSVCQFDGKGIL